MSEADRLGLMRNMKNLRQLMAAYFHQDWWDEYGGVWESAVDDFARREPRRVGGAAQEIADLLDSNVESDEVLGRTLDALGNFRDPGDAPDAHIVWLREVRERLIRSAGSAR